MHTTSAKRVRYNQSQREQIADGRYSCILILIFIIHCMNVWETFLLILPMYCVKEMAVWSLCSCLSIDMKFVLYYKIHTDIPYRYFGRKWNSFEVTVSHWARLGRSSNCIQYWHSPRFKRRMNSRFILWLSIQTFVSGMTYHFITHFEWYPWVQNSWISFKIIYW